MKIVNEPQQPTLAQSIENKAEKTGQGAARQKSTPKSATKGDSVDISASSMDTELKSRQAEQAKRVESIKALVQAGKYEVSSRAVAKKMLSGSSGS